MKKLFTLFAACVIAVSLMGQDVTISSYFNGIRLGQSTKDNVHNTLLTQGLLFDEESSDTINFAYRGRCIHNGMAFDGITTRYLEDTVILVGYYGKCDSACSNYGQQFLERVHAKYGNLPSADTSVYVKMMTIDVQDFNIWSRTDGKNIILTVNNDTVCTCLYFAESRIREIMVNMLAGMLIKASPDYADENKVYGVGGVKFGDHREVVRKSIYAKSSKFLDSDEHSLNFYQTKIGGTTYDYATFYFSGNKGLVSVNLQQSFYSWREKEARMAFEGVKNQYSRKYSNFKVVKEEEDNIVCTCGAFIDGYDYPPIFISFSKSLSLGGSIMYYIQVDYYYYNRSAMYDDEI